jgi:hypothetical protein
MVSSTRVPGSYQLVIEVPAAVRCAVDGSVNVDPPAAAPTLGSVRGRRGAGRKREAEEERAGHGAAVHDNALSCHRFAPPRLKRRISWNRRGHQGAGPFAPTGA